MKHRIITISREFGSGGRTIGKAANRRSSVLGTRTSGVRHTIGFTPI